MNHNVFHNIFLIYHDMFLIYPIFDLLQDGCNLPALHITTGRRCEGQPQSRSNPDPGRIPVQVPSCLRPRRRPLRLKAPGSKELRIQELWMQEPLDPEAPGSRSSWMQELLDPEAFMLCGQLRASSSECATLCLQHLPPGA